MTTQRNDQADHVEATAAETPTQMDLSRVAASEDDGARETRPIPALDLETTEASDEPSQSPDSPVGARDVEEDDDSGATVAQEAVRSTPAATRPRKTTLAVAINRQTTGPRAESTSAPKPENPTRARADEELPAEVEDEVDEWSLADQPTVYLSPNQTSGAPPDFLETGSEQPWPPRPTVRPSSPQRPVPTTRPVTPRPPAPTAPRRPAEDRPGYRSAYSDQRLATPEGRVMPGTPPAGVPRAAVPNPRMERFQELRRQRVHHEEGERDDNDARPVREVVRRWWSDLLPGLESGLDHQREARASGMHPIPAYEPAATGRLGDAFGRLAASARELTGRAQAVAAPRLKRLHDQAEQAAGRLVERFEGSPARQQAPLLGPGRIAVFFKQGVTVGQAQRLLTASHARPIRLIPRKHGFLALVAPGTEADIGMRMREHPYVRDVAYLDYDEYGDAREPN
jgi:hypothetical protein